MKNIKKLLVNFLKIITGLIISSLLSIVFYTIFEFILVDFGVKESGLLYIIACDLIPFALFILTFFFWVKSKSVKTYILIVILLVFFYLLGKAYANKIVKPFHYARQLVKEAEENNEWTKLSDQNLYLEGQRNYVSKYEQAASQNFGYESWIKKYYNDLYELKKEILAQDEKVISGELSYTTEESEKILKEYLERQEKIVGRGLILPYWMSFYKVY